MYCILRFWSGFAMFSSVRIGLLFIVHFRFDLRRQKALQCGVVKICFLLCATMLPPACNKWISVNARWCAICIYKWCCPLLIISFLVYTRSTVSAYCAVCTLARFREKYSPVRRYTFLRYSFTVNEREDLARGRVCVCVTWKHLLLKLRYFNLIVEFCLYILIISCLEGILFYPLNTRV